MVNAISTLAPPANLSVTYTPKAFRMAFELLLEVDNRLQSVVQNAREPMIAQIKMAWWREAFANLPQSRPKGEPLLHALYDVGDVIPLTALETLVAAWEALLGSERWDKEVIATHATLRAKAIFQTYAHWVGASQDVQLAGQGWANDALRLAFPERFPADAAPAVVRLPKNRKLRPLSILMLSVRTRSGPRLVWHALTGL